MSSQQQCSPSTVSDPHVVDSAILYNYTKFEQRMLQLTSHRYVIVVVMSILYSASLLHSYMSLSLLHFSIYVAMVIMQLCFNRKHVLHYSDLEIMDTGVNIGEEQVRIVVSLIAFTVRHFILNDQLILLLPMLFLWVMSHSQIFKVSVKSGLFPLFYLTCLFLGKMWWTLQVEYTHDGFTNRSLVALYEGLTMTCSLWCFVFYLGKFVGTHVIDLLVNVTGSLNQKVVALVETETKLKTAIQRYVLGSKLILS